MNQKLLVIEAVFFLFSAKLLLLSLPIKNVIKFSLSHKSSDKNNNPDIISKVKRALSHAGKFSFWKNKCLVLCIAGRWMLQRRRIPSKISFGVNMDKNKKLIAHSWLKSGSFEIINKGGEYQELISY